MLGTELEKGIPAVGTRLKGTGKGTWVIETDPAAFTVVLGWGCSYRGRSEVRSHTGEVEIKHQPVELEELEEAEG